MPLSSENCGFANMCLCVCKMSDLEFVKGLD